MKTVIQIVPRRANAPEGVGDYARIIAEHLLENHGMRTIFVACALLPLEQRVQDSWETIELPKRSAAALFKLLCDIAADNSVPVLLHMSGYGYQRKGTPLWLANGLTRWRRRNPDTPLVTVFHEIYATGPMTGSAFWLAPVQRRIIRRILRLSTGALTTMERYGKLLSAWMAPGQRPIVVCPVFSTIGEGKSNADLRRRAPIMAVFGRGDMSETLYRRHRATIEQFVRREEIEAIVDIGKRPAATQEVVAGITVEMLGEAPANVVRDRLAMARFGLMNYDADFLAKSSIFAAYCAFGAVPVCISDQRGDHDETNPGVNYIKLGHQIEQAAIEPRMLDDLQANAHSWYRSHNIDQTVSKIICALQEKADHRFVTDAS